MPEHNTLLDEAASTAIPRITARFLDTVFSEMSKTGSKSVGRIRNSIGDGFEDYMKRCVRKCSMVKTLIKRSEPVQLHSIYINQKFSCDALDYDDSEVLDYLLSRNSIVVYGNAGSGKSMFMKYSYLRTLVTSPDKIPLFIELRHLNDMNHDRGLLINGITEHLNTLIGRFDVARLEDGLKRGLFCLFLDGLDEIRFEKRNSIGAEISELPFRYPDTPIIVSSRPSDIFVNWEYFSLFRVKPFEIDQTNALIRKIEYDPETKTRFLASVKKKYRHTHASFLTNPLLSTMMLLTFDQFGEIPEKLHLFYEKCFSVLSEEHDSTKQNFFRKLFCGLDKARFEAFFMNFCLVTYADGHRSVSEDEIKYYIDCSSDLIGEKLSWIDVLKDMTESTSILQKDGTDYSFIHRSFQEYFVARFIAVEGNIDRYRIVTRLGKNLLFDDILHLSFDINRDNMERDYLLPNLATLLGILDNIDINDRPVDFLKVFFEMVRFEHNGRVGQDGEFRYLLRYREYDSENPGNTAHIPLYDLLMDKYRNLLKDDLPKVGVAAEKSRQAAKNLNIDLRDEISLNGESGDKFNKWILDTGSTAFYACIYQGFYQLFEVVKQRTDRRKERLSSIIFKEIRSKDEE